MSIRVLNNINRGCFEMKWLIAILLVATLYSCVPNDSTSNYRKVEVVLYGIENSHSKTLLILIEGNLRVCKYNRDVFKVDWLTIVRTQNDYPHFILLADEKNNLYHL